MLQREPVDPKFQVECAITSKRYEIGRQLLLIGSRIVFRLIPTFVTLNDLERRNRLYFCFISPNSIVLLAYYVTVIEDRSIMSAEYYLPLLAKTDPP